MRKGVSPAVSYVLLLMVGVTVAVLAFLWANSEVTKLQESPLLSYVESQMMTVDSAVQSVSHGDTNFTTRIDLYYEKGVMQVDEDRDWIKYTGNLHAGYPGEITTAGLSDECPEDVHAVEDNDTSIKMSRITQTNVFRGSSGSAAGGAQMVEVVTCFDNVDIVADETCVGRSGPRAVLSMRKTGYDAVNDKPIVEVAIC